MHKHLLLVLASACVMRHRPPPAPPFQYGPELHEIADAIDDLKNVAGLSATASSTIGALEEAFRIVCTGEKVSCDRAKWMPTWEPKGDAVSSLAHALGDADRAYSALRGGGFALVTSQLEDARRGIRELLVRRERLDARLPEDRQLVFTREDLQYVRTLIGSEMPPADDVWDYEKGIRELDAAISMLDASDLDPDRAHIPIVVPNPTDFAGLPYRDRISVAYDVIGRAYEDFKSDRKSPLERKKHEQLQEHLLNVHSALGHATNSNAVRT